MMKNFKNLRIYPYTSKSITTPIQRIWLTVDEARQVHSVIAFAMMTTKSFSHQKELSELIDVVAERIKQTEKDNETEVE